MAKPNETPQEWLARYRTQVARTHAAAAYVWCPWCKCRAKGYRHDGKSMASCRHCGKRWQRHKGVPTTPAAGA